MKKTAAAQAGLLVAGLLAGALLCGVAQSKGWLGTQSAGVPPADAPSWRLEGGGAAEGPESAALPQTMTLRRGSLEQVLTASGTVRSTSLQNVNTSLTAPIVAIYVQQGDTVKAGDALCRLDTAELDKDIEAARANIAKAEAGDALKLAQAERRLEQLRSELAANEALRSRALDDALHALEAARIQTATDTANSTVTGEAVTLATQDVRQAEEYVQLTPERLPNGEPNPAWQIGLDALSAAQTALANAVAAYETAWQNVYSQTYESCRPAAETAAYEQAAAKWDDTLRQNQKSIADAQDTADTCRAADSAAAYRATLEKKLLERARHTITAPAGGTVTAVGAQLGNTPGNREGAALFTIQNTGSLVVEAEVPEHSAVSLYPGLPVSITADALTGREWHGAVSAVSPTADDEARFTVTVRLGGGAEGLAVGMTANLEALLGVRQNVFAVPLTAIAQNGEGRAVIYAAEEPGGEFGEIWVEKVMESGRRAEIEGEALTEGLVVLLYPEKETGAAT